MHALRLFLPGAFAGLPEVLRAAWMSIYPCTPLDFHEFVPSGMLAQEIVAGAEADVFVSANQRFMDDVVAAGRIAAPRRLAGNRLCAFVLQERSQDITSFDDILRPGVTIVTPQAETDPCGQYIAAMWEEAGLTAAIAAKAASGEIINSRGSGDLPAFVFDGRADVGVFYSSETVALGDRVAVIEIPPAWDSHDRIAFWIGAVALSAEHPTRPESEAFLDFMTGEIGQQLLARHGFLPTRLACS